MLSSPFLRARSGCSRRHGRACRRSRARRGPEASRACGRAHGVSFSQVRAILRDSCEHCHNEETAEGSLVLKSYDTLIAGGESGNPIVPGKSASSLLVQAIEGRVKPRMPYKEDPLSAAEIDTIRRWIDAGAPGRPPPSGRGGEGRDSGRPAHRSCQRSGVRGGVRRHDATDRGRLVQIGPLSVLRRPEVEPLARRARRPGPRARVLGRWHTARGCRRGVRPRGRGSHLGRPADARQNRSRRFRDTRTPSSAWRSRPTDPQSPPAATTSS